ncbi:MAG TPA: FAD/NAD(P)-binding protein [Jatrophihabitans sp.]|nr:FAD/NAD(P)-binding protein [Jatrophihabitans sp.]
MSAAISVAIIGFGSRGLGVLERLLAVADSAEPESSIRIEVIDPVAVGAGVHDRQQPDYLLLNTICSQVSMFPDADSVGAAIGLRGPSLYEWACERELRIADDGFTVGRHGRPIRPTDFLPRRLLGDYLAWFAELLLARQTDRIRITLHRSDAVELAAEPDGGLLITLASGEVVRASGVFLTTGYTANLPPTDSTGHLISEPYPMPASFEKIRAGQSVAISGFGLSAMDAVSSFTVGRGGRFLPDGAGVRYLASGQEPRLLLYSRTGLPCRARLRTLEFGPRYQAVVFTPAQISALRAARGGPLDFYADIWPLVLDELRVCYRRRQALSVGPGTSEQLELRLLDAQADRRVGALLDELDRESGPFDPTPLLDPSSTMCLRDSVSYQQWFADLLRADLVEGELGFSGSLVKATLDVLRDLRDTFRFAVDFGGVTERSLELFHADTVPMLNRAVVGPQFERHAELLALLRAGVLEVPLGPNPTVDWDGEQSRWLLRSRHLSSTCTRFADWWVAGRVGLPTVASSASPLINSLYRKGWIRPLKAGSRLLAGIDIDPDQHPVAADGQADQRIWVLGPICEGATFYNNLVPSPGCYSRPVHDAHRCVTALMAAGRRIAQPA